MTVSVFLIDLGSDDQQVPVFSDQLLWNPYWWSLNLTSLKQTWVSLLSTPLTARPSGWKLLDLSSPGPCVVCWSFMCVRDCMCVCGIQCVCIFKIVKDSRDVIGPWFECHHPLGGWRSHLPLLQPWGTCWDFPAALECVLCRIAELWPEHGTIVCTYNCIRLSTSSHLHPVSLWFCTEGQAACFVL